MIARPAVLIGAVTLSLASLAAGAQPRALQDQHIVVFEEGASPLAAAAAAAAVGASPRHVYTAALTPLSIDVSCTPYSTPDTGYCYATAAGGSGSGYSFTWSLATETYDNGGVSQAYPSYCYDGSLFYIYATVTDSNGATADGWSWTICNYSGGGGTTP
jgi:hypothetical protein